jgi:glyoxylase-like metal-dependent hydrolase (beta-lactamase superfamily II)
MKKLFDGVYMLEGEIGGRPLQLMYLKGETASLLMDSGCAHDPVKFIAPQISEADGEVSSLTWILNTHPDLDHICGNHEMKKLAPRAILACGDADRHICQGIDALMCYRYDVYRSDHRIGYEGDTLAWIRSEGGEPEPIDVTFRGGEHIRLGPGWELELIAVPGHAEGHLAVYDPLHQALYGADAIHGRGNPGLVGGMKLCPTYENVDQYLATIDRIEHLPITTYVGCHWPVKRGAGIAEFCRESRDFVQTTERLLLDQLTTPQTVRELCTILGPKLGDWPRETDLGLVYVLNGHLRRMCERGVVSSQMRNNDQQVREFVRSSTARMAEK